MATHTVKWMRFKIDKERRDSCPSSISRMASTFLRPKKLRSGKPPFKQGLTAGIPCYAVCTMQRSLHIPGHDQLGTASPSRLMSNRMYQRYQDIFRNGTRCPPGTESTVSVQRSQTLLAGCEVLLPTQWSRYLGYQISAEVITIFFDKVKTVGEWPTTHKVKEN